jgi:hypothetical protein
MMPDGVIAGDVIVGDIERFADIALVVSMAFANPKSRILTVPSGRTLRAGSKTRMVMFSRVATTQAKPWDKPGGRRLTFAADDCREESSCFGVGSMGRDTVMTSSRRLRGLLLGAFISAVIACGSSSSPTSSSAMTDTAVVALEGLTATVEPINSPGTGWLYRLTYHAHETGGKTGATLTATHIALSNGQTADGDFNGPGMLQKPRVPASGIITAETNLSVLTPAAAAPHVAFTVSYTDDNGHTGSADAAVDITPLKP